MKKQDVMKICTEHKDGGKPFRVEHNSADCPVCRMEDEIEALEAEVDELNEKAGNS